MRVSDCVRSASSGGLIIETRPVRACPTVIMANGIHPALSPCEGLSQMRMGPCPRGTGESIGSGASRATPSRLWLRRGFGLFRRRERARAEPPAWGLLPAPTGQRHLKPKQCSHFPKACPRLAAQLVTRVRQDLGARPAAFACRADVSRGDALPKRWVDLSSSFGRSSCPCT